MFPGNQGSLPGQERLADRWGQGPERERKGRVSSVPPAYPFLPPTSLRIPPQPLRLLPPSAHLSVEGRGPLQHPSSVTLTLSLFKLPPLPPLVQNVILWAQWCQGGDWSWSWDGGWCWSCFGVSRGKRGKIEALVMSNPVTACAHTLRLYQKPIQTGSPDNVPTPL